jgi:DNA repair photolyase
MYQLKPDRIYAHEDLRANPDAMIRLRRFLATMGRPESDVDWFAPQDAIRVSAEAAAWTPDRDTPDWKLRQPIIFTRFVVDGSKVEDDPIAADPPEDVALYELAHVLGYMAPFVFHHSPEADAKSGMVCWPSKFLASVTGCAHGCVYCGAGRDGKALIISLNVRDYLDKVVRKVMDDNPWQRCFLMMGNADLATLEPEYGLYEGLLNLLSEYEDRYAYFHTNGDCVDWIENLTHRERLIGVWSLCSNKVAEMLEPCAPTASSRIAAMAKLADWGVPVRVKLKPILPVRGWRESFAGLIEELLRKVKPETLGFSSLVWMTCEHFERTFDTDLIDPTFVEAARAAREDMSESSHGPFPHEKRAELYRFMIREARKYNPGIPLFLSTETGEMWDELSGELGQNPRRFFCGCNPVQGPGPRFLTSTLTESNYSTNKQARATGSSA